MNVYILTHPGKNSSMRVKPQKKEAPGCNRGTFPQIMPCTTLLLSK
jgi:hypothetical protein